MDHYLLTCRSLTHAQNLARTLERSGISAVIIKTPQNASSGGCGYSVKIRKKYLSAALSRLKRNDLRPVKVLLQDALGTYEEVGE